MKSFRSELEICDVAEVPTESSWIVNERSYVTGEDRKKTFFSTRIEHEFFFFHLFSAEDFFFSVLYILLLK